MSPRRARPRSERLPEPTLQHLAVRLTGQLVDQLDRRRHLEVREVLATEVAQLVGRDRRTRLDDRKELLSKTRVGDPEHRAVDDRRMPEQDVLDLARVHVHAASDHHVDRPVGEVEVAVVVEVADVADGERVVAPGASGLVGVVVVVEAHAPGWSDVDDPGRAGGHRLALLVEDADLGAGPRQPHTAWPLEPLRHRDLRRAALAHPVELGDLTRRERLDDPLLHRHRARRAAMNDEP